jgi:hypothetical protein
MMLMSLIVGIPAIHISGARYSGANIVRAFLVINPEGAKPHGG